MNKTALFTNFTEEEFIGYWDGKAKKFVPGQSIYMPDYLAKHFAKHLANRELLKKGLDRDTSPKVKMAADGTEYVDNLTFTEMFNRAYTPDEEEIGETKTDVDTLIDVANKNRAEKAPKEEPGVQIAEFPDDDEDEFENKPVDITPNE